MPITQYKTLPEKYDKFLTFIGLFVPVPMLSVKFTPDFVINGWGFGSTIGVNKVPLGLIMILIAILF